MEFKYTEIDKIIPYARNPRKNDAAVANVAASLKEFGWQQPIVVDNENVVIVGHTRLEAARMLGMDKVPVVVADNLTPAQAKAYRIADNRTGETAEWDIDLLGLELSDLQDMEFDIDLIGFDESYIGEIEILNDNGAEASNSGGKEPVASYMIAVYDVAFSDKSDENFIRAKKLSEMYHDADDIEKADIEARLKATVMSEVDEILNR